MPMTTLQREQIRSIFVKIKPYFRQRLGKYTHQRISGDWHFHGLGFVNGNMTYVFGINIGFFKKSDSRNYSHVGMNILVRTNGINKDLRLRYRSFFKEILADWIFEDGKIYTSERGGVGTEFPKYKSISSFENEEEINDFLKECIDGIHNVYPKIHSEGKDLFQNVLRAAPPWDDSIIGICETALNIEREKE